MPSRNGAPARGRDKVRVGIIGVGNCASSLIQGVHYYRNANDSDRVPGLMHVNLGGYHVSDIEFSCAFDIDRAKVGRDLSDAIFRGQNNTIKFAKVPRQGVKVSRGMTHDGLGKYLQGVIHKAPGHTDDIVRVLKETRTDVLVNYLPVGTEDGTKWYMEQALQAGVGVVNCMPVFIAREEYWQRRFEEKGLPIVGDDIKSQVGATIVHRVLTRLFEDRGVQLENTYQLNFGGNTDFLNMLERERLESKKISKTNAVTSQLDTPLDDKNVHVGPSDYVPWLRDRKWAFIRLEGKSFGNTPLNIEMKLEVHDSPNSAGIVIDAVRFCKLALDHGIAGALHGPSAWLMKSPPIQYHDDIARQLAEGFISNPVATPPPALRVSIASARPENGAADRRTARSALRARKVAGAAKPKAPARPALAVSSGGTAKRATTAKPKTTARSAAAAGSSARAKPAATTPRGAKTKAAAVAQPRSSRPARVVARSKAGAARK